MFSIMALGSHLVYLSRTISLSYAIQALDRNVIRRL
jgi:hypothetical protein